MLFCPALASLLKTWAAETILRSLVLAVLDLRSLLKIQLVQLLTAISTGVLWDMAVAVKVIETLL
jgi:hypothetical protein